MGAVNENGAGRDSWATQDGRDEDYSPHKFYPQVGGEVGRQVRVALSHNDMRTVTQMVQQETYPELQTFQDVIRDALYHRLRWLQHNQPIDDEFVERVRLSALAKETERHHQELAIWESTVDQIKTVLARAHGNGDTRMVRKLLDQYESYAVGLGKPWGDRLWEILDTYRDGSGDGGRA